MTSLVLVILAVSVRAVSWADAALRRREAQRIADRAEPTHATVTTETEPETEAADHRARAAAIAVALALSQQSHQRETSVDQTPISTDTGTVHDAWLTEGRARQRSRRGAAGSAKDWR